MDWYCCSCCEKNSCGDICNGYFTCFPFKRKHSIFEWICGIITYALSFAIVYLFYFLIFLWIDIYHFCKKSHVYYSLGKKDAKKGESNEIWKLAHFVGELESSGPWICLECKHNSNSFKDFIFQSNDLNRNTELQNLKADDFYLYRIISVLFNSADGQINYSITCKKTNIFSNVEKKLLDKFPEYKNNKLFYVTTWKCY